MASLVITAMLVVLSYRTKRDKDQLAAGVKERGGMVVELKRVRKGHPFADAGRGWWAWRVLWKEGTTVHTAWALTTREGIKEWRD